MVETGERDGNEHLVIYFSVFILEQRWRKEWEGMDLDNGLQVLANVDSSSVGPRRYSETRSHTNIKIKHRIREKTEGTSVKA